jgi:hypothetical protein
MSEREQVWCPSSQPTEPGAVVLGVRSGPSGGVVYLELPAPAAAAVAAVPAGVHPTQVVRFAAPCRSTCGHFENDTCTLVDKVVAGTAPTDSASVPRCHLRPRCRWWQQSGVDACRRCTLVQTFTAAGDTERELIADPATRVPDVVQRAG